MGVAIQRHFRGLLSIKTSMLEQSALAFADYMKDFLLKTDASKEGLGAVLSQKQVDGQFSSSSLWQLVTDSP